MINGVDLWDDRTCYYTQSNNALERMLSRYGAKASAVTCGPSASINCLASMGYDVETITPGVFRPQPEDVLALWFHDPRNWATLAKVRSATDPNISDYSPHEVPQYYPAAINAVFGVPARFQWGKDFDEIVDDVETGHAVMVNLKPGNTGHFVAVVAYDEERDELIYHDSWPEGIPGHNGFAVRLDRDEFNVTQPYKIVFGENE